MTDGPVSSEQRVAGDEAGFRISWARLVGDVLDSTARACQDLRQCGDVQASWPEDRISIRLMDFMEERFDERYALGLQHYELTDDIRSGDAPLVSAKRPDLAVSLRQHSPHRTGRLFRWEAKRFAGQAGSWQAYVVDGMFRHIDGTYSRNVGDGGMLGYLLQESASAVVDGVNGVIATGEPLPAAEQLQPLGQTSAGVHRLYSRHDRPTVGKPISLHHLMLEFGSTP